MGIWECKRKCVCFVRFVLKFCWRKFHFSSHHSNTIHMRKMYRRKTILHWINMWMFYIKVKSARFNWISKNLKCEKLNKKLNWKHDPLNVVCIWKRNSSKHWMNDSLVLKRFPIQWNYFDIFDLHISTELIVFEHHIFCSCCNWMCRLWQIHSE